MSGLTNAGGSRARDRGPRSGTPSAKRLWTVVGPAPALVGAGFSRPGSAVAQRLLVVAINSQMSGLTYARWLAADAGRHAECADSRGIQGSAIVSGLTTAGTEVPA